MDAESGEFMPIPIGEFITGVTTPVNIYIRLSDQKFVLIAKAGTKTAKEQIETYHNKSIDYLWIKHEDFPRMTKQSIAIAGVVMSQNKFNMQQKSRFLTAAVAPVFSDLDKSGFTYPVYENAMRLTEVTLSMVEAHRDLFALFEGLKACGDEFIANATAVCGVSLMIAQQLKWENKITLEKLALGALLHDIGMKTLPKEIVAKPIYEMSPEEISLYETHPFRGMTMLSQLGVVPDDVISIVYEHHENAMGMGFPRRIRDLKIHPLARVVSLAAAFVQLVLPAAGNPNPKNVREALVYIEYTQGLPYNREVFRALKRILGDDSIAA